MIHHLLGGSSAYRWTPCPASVFYAELVAEHETKRPEGVFAKEGHRLHDRAEAILKGAAKLDICDPDYAALAPYVNHVAMLRENAPARQEWVECLVSVTDGDVPSGGTMDYGQYDPSTFTLTVVDYKTGKELVDEFENSQLDVYTLGLLKLIHPAPVDYVVHTIVQPFAWKETVRASSFPIVEFIPRMMAIDNAIAEYTSGEATIARGAHCKYCPALFFCQLTSEAVMRIKKTDIGQITSLNDDQLAELLETATHLERVLEQAKKEAARRAFEDRRILPRHKLIRGRGSRTFDETAVANLLSTLPQDVRANLVKGLYTTELASPSAAEKKLSPDLYEKYLDPLVISTLGALQLVHESARGKPVDQVEINFKPVAGA